MYVQICFDYKSKCAFINVLNSYGKKVKELQYCKIELLEVSGTTRIPLNERLLKDYLCISADNLDAIIEYKGSVLRIK